MPKVCVEFDAQTPSEPSIRTYTTLIGNGSATQFDVHHNLDTDNVIVVSTVAGTGEVLDPAVTLLNDDMVRLLFDTPPSVNGVRVRVTGFHVPA